MKLTELIKKHNLRGRLIDHNNKGFIMKAENNEWEKEKLGMDEVHFAFLFDAPKDGGSRLEERIIPMGWCKTLMYARQQIGWEKVA